VVMIRVTPLAAEPLNLQSGYLVPGPWVPFLCQILLEVSGAVQYHELGVYGDLEHFQSVVLGSPKGPKTLSIESFCD
jgi:hypothetical protein